MTRAERAVAVAKDVIAQVKKRNSNLLVMEGNGYIRAEFRPDNTGGDLQDILPELLKKPCEVCALGAAVISKARLFDNVPLDTICETNYWDDDEIVISPDVEPLRQHLSSVFTKTDLVNIECAFEVSPDFNENSATRSTYGAVVFGAKYKDPKKRLVAIMQNIIDNNGRFVVKPVDESTMDEALGKFVHVMERTLR